MQTRVAEKSSLKTKSVGEMVAIYHGTPSGLGLNDRLNVTASGGEVKHGQYFTTYAVYVKLSDCALPAKGAET